MFRFSIIIILVGLSACATTQFYTGNEYYFTEDGVNWSCRDPEPFKGGNCKPESEWEKSSNVDL